MKYSKIEEEKNTQSTKYNTILVVKGVSYETLKTTRQPQDSPTLLLEYKIFWLALSRLQSEKGFWTHMTFVFSENFSLERKLQNYSRKLF